MSKLLNWYSTYKYDGSNSSVKFIDCVSAVKFPFLTKESMGIDSVLEPAPGGAEANYNFSTKASLLHGNACVSNK